MRACGASFWDHCACWLDDPSDDLLVPFGGNLLLFQLLNSRVHAILASPCALVKMLATAGFALNFENFGFKLGEGFSIDGLPQRSLIA